MNDPHERGEGPEEGRPRQRRRLLRDHHRDDDRPHHGGDGEQPPPHEREGGGQQQHGPPRQPARLLDRGRDADERSIDGDGEDEHEDEDDNEDVGAEDEASDDEASDGLLEDAEADDEQEQGRRREEIRDDFLMELKSGRRTCVLANLVKEGGGDGELLWEGSTSRTRLFERCVGALSEAGMAEFLCLLVAEHPDLLAKQVGSYGNLLHLAVHHALRPSRLYDRSFATIRLLTEMHPDMLHATNLAGCTPLHLFCRSFNCDDPNFLALIQWLVDGYPDALRAVCPGDGHTPIMDALCHGRLQVKLPSGALHLLHRMIELGGPTSLLTLDTGGHRSGNPSALRYAASSCLNKELISSLVEAAPDALSVAGDRGKVPLHHACFNIWSEGGPEVLEAVQIMIDGRSSSLEVSDDNGFTPVILAIVSAPRAKSQRSPEVIRFLQRMIQRAPKSVVGMHTQEGRRLAIRTALREALVRLPELASSLIDTCDWAVQLIDSDGNFPLHIACNHSLRTAATRVANTTHSTIKLIERLMDQCPAALEASDNRGYTPIMIAIGSASSMREGIASNVIELLQKMIRRGGSRSLWREVTGAEGNAVFVTALHELCSHLPHLELMESLTATWAEAIRMRDQCGQFPIHRALQRLTSGGPPGLLLAAIRRLVREYPAGLEAADNGGMTPIMRAIWREIPLRSPPPPPETMQYLHKLILSCPPKALLTHFVSRDQEVTTTALHFACVNRHIHELVPPLINKCPAAFCFSHALEFSHLPEGIADTASIEAHAVLLALLEVLLHETTSGSVPDLIREHVRQAAGRFLRPHHVSGCSSAVARALEQRVREERGRRQLRSDVLNHEALQHLLGSDEALQEMVAGVYRMNKAGRAAREPEGEAAGDRRAMLSTWRHVRVLGAARGDLSSLFLRLRECPAATGRLLRSPAAAALQDEDL